MKTKIFFIFFLVSMPYAIRSSNKTAINLNKQTPKNQTSAAASLVFLPTIPTKSINEKNIDQIYGSQGLNIANDALIKIKQAYCYLEFLYKIDYVKKNPTNPEYIKDFNNFLQPNTNNLPLMPTQTLVQTSSWNSIPTTPQSLAASDAWQLFLKSMIYESFARDSDFLLSVTDANSQLSSYLPNIEMAYATKDFQKLRLYTESLQIQALMLDEQRHQYLAQTHDWKKLNTPALTQAINKFTSSDFYSYSHGINIKKDPKNKIVPSPIREQIICYFMFIHIQMTIYDLINLDTIEVILAAASSSYVSPNFFFYKPSDTINLSDLFAIKNSINDLENSPDLINLTMQQTDQPVTAQADLSTKNQSDSKEDSTDPQAQAASLLFEQLPTTSIHQTTIDQIYGSSGLNIDKVDLDNLKKTYCYLEFLVKLNKVKNDPQYAQYKNEFAPFLNPAANSHLPMPTQTLVNSPSWQAITTTSEDIIASQTWQNFVKTMICDCYDNQATFIVDSCEANDQMFPYLANIETAYKTDDFTQIRYYLESLEIQAEIAKTQQQRYLLQSADWKNLNNQSAIQSAITNFKKTDFYQQTHNQSNASKSKNKPSTPNYDTLNQIAGYFMLISMQKKIYEMMTLNNLESFLTQASSSTLQANLFFHTPQDYIYLSDFLLLAQLDDAHKKSTTKSQVFMNPTPSPTPDSNDQTGQVVIQKARSKAERDFEKLGKGFKKVGKDIKKGMNTMVNGIIKGSNSVADALIDTSSGLTWLSCSIGKGLGIKVNPNYEARRVKAKMNAHKNVISEVVGGVLLTCAAILTVNPYLLASEAGLFVTANITDKRVSSVTKLVIKEAMEKPLMTIMMPIMKGMEALTTGMTEYYIDIMVTYAYVGTSIAKGLGFKVNPEQVRNRVKAKLEKNKMVLNIISSVILTVIITAVVIICTAGVGAVQAFMADSAALSAATASGAAATTEASVAAAVAAESATSVAAAQAAAEAAAVAAEQLTAIAATGTSAEIAAAEAAAQTARIAAQVAAETATKASAASEAAEAAMTAQENAVQVATKAGESISQATTNLAKSSNIITNTIKAAQEGIASWSFVISQALNAGFSVFSAIGAVNQQESAELHAEREQESIETLWGFIEDTKANIVSTQNIFLDELHKKHQVAVENQTFGLNYYKNFLNSSVQTIRIQIAQALAQQYIQMLTPDSNGLKPANIGSSWGLQGPFMYLYPSQGFLSTTLGRPDFPYAQEVAQAPLASETQSTNSSAQLGDDQPQATKLWFNQRAISTLKQTPEAPLDVEIAFRIIYSLNTDYHVGLYLGGTYYDYNSAVYLQSIQNSGTIDIDQAHLAKMFVLKRDTAQSSPVIGLYENEGLGWIEEQPIVTNIVDNASIYHMKAHLDKTQLTVSFWSERNPANIWAKTVTVTACDQRTFGMIFSGIAVEWGVVTPKLSIIENQQTRGQSDGQSEIAREKASKAQWKQLLKPKFGSMNIQSLGRPALLQGQYLYTTQSTGLTDGQGNPITDYIVFANFGSGTVNNIGMSPASNSAQGISTVQPNAIVSMISGNVYNAFGNIVAHQQNPWQAYAQTNSSWAATFTPTITQAIQNYQQALLNITFGTYQLTALSSDALNQGIFIYTCPTTLTSANSSGDTNLDYLIMAQLVNNVLGSSMGMPPSSLVQGMVSLVTGNVYSKTSATPVETGYTNILTEYTKQFPQLPAAILATITSAASTYQNTANAQAQSAQEQKYAQANVVASETVSLASLLNSGPPATGGLQVGLTSAAPSKIIPTNQSISKLQTAAAGSATVEISSASQTNSSAGVPTPTPVSAQPVTQPAQSTTATTAASTNMTFTLAGNSGLSF